MDLFCSGTDKAIRRWIIDHTYGSLSNLVTHKTASPLSVGFAATQGAKNVAIVDHTLSRGYAEVVQLEPETARDWRPVDANPLFWFDGLQAGIAVFAEVPPTWLDASVNKRNAALHGANDKNSILQSVGVLASQGWPPTTVLPVIQMVTNGLWYDLPAISVKQPFSVFMFVDMEATGSAFRVAFSMGDLSIGWNGSAYCAQTTAGGSRAIQAVATHPRFAPTMLEVYVNGNQSQIIANRDPPVAGALDSGSFLERTDSAGK